MLFGSLFPFHQLQNFSTGICTMVDYRIYGLHNGHFHPILLCQNHSSIQGVNALNHHAHLLHRFCRGTP